MNKNLYILYTGQFVTKICSIMSYIAIIWLFSSFPNGPIYIGVFGAISLIPSIILPVFIGVLLDRFSRKHTIIVSDIISGFNLLIITLLVSNFTQNINYIYLLLFISSCCGTLFSCAVEPLYYDIISKNEYPRMASTRSILVKSASIIAPVLAGYLIHNFGVRTLLIIEGSSYIISGISEIFIRANQEIRVDKFTPIKFYTDLKDVCLFVRKTRILVLILFIGLIVNFFTAPIIPMLPVFVREVLSKSVNEVGLLQSAMSVGAIIASIYIGFIRKREFTAMEYSLPFVLSGLLLIVFSVNRIFLLSLAIFLAVSLAFSVSNFVTDLLIQYNISSENRTRVLSLFSYIQFMQPLAMLLSGIASKYFGVAIIYLLAGLAIMSCGFVTLRISEFKKAREIIFST